MLLDLTMPGMDGGEQPASASGVGETIAAAHIGSDADRGKVVLLVDDDETVRKLARRILEQDGHTVIEAADGTNALALAEECGGGLGCVLLDLTMPGMDGAEAFKGLRQQNSALPVVIMSGKTAKSVAEIFPGEAQIGFVQKPFTPDQLRQAVTRWIPAS